MRLGQQAPCRVAADVTRDGLAEVHLGLAVVVLVKVHGAEHRVRARVVRHIGEVLLQVLLRRFEFAAAECQSSSQVVQQRVLHALADHIAELCCGGGVLLVVDQHANVVDARHEPVQERRVRRFEAL